MSEDAQAPQTIDPSTTLPIVLSVPEIQGILIALRKVFTMEQAEPLVNNIQNQTNALLQQLKQAEANETNETTETTETGETK